MMTIKNKYMLSRIDDLFDQLYLVLVFSKVNLLIGYHQLKTNEEGVPKISLLVLWLFFTNQLRSNWDQVLEATIE